MQKPAARLGDRTLHGGAVVSGCLTVLIGSKPAARIGDGHVCPVVSPGPPVPHVGGPVVGGSPSVLIGGAPAARLGDLASCCGPLDVITTGSADVLIGPGSRESALATSGYGPGGSQAPGNAGKGFADGDLASGESKYWIAFRMQDSSGRELSGVPVRVSGLGRGDWDDSSDARGIVSASGLAPEDCRLEARGLHSATWSVDEAAWGDLVDLKVDCDGFADGEKVLFRVFGRSRSNGVNQVFQATGCVRDEKATADLRLARRCPSTGTLGDTFHFEASIGDVRASSSALQVVDLLGISLKWSDGGPVSRKKYEIVSADGVVKSGELSAGGETGVLKVSAGQHRVIYPDLSGVFRVRSRSIQVGSE